MCADNGECKGWNYDFKDCTLFKATITQLEESQYYRPNMVSGYKSLLCQKQGEMELHFPKLFSTIFWIFSFVFRLYDQKLGILCRRSDARQHNDDTLPMRARLLSGQKMWCLEFQPDPLYTCHLPWPTMCKHSSWHKSLHKNCQKPKNIIQDKQFMVTDHLSYCGLKKKCPFKYSGDIL